MDAWGMDELLHLPPSGWIGFTMTMLLAEETGQWPLVLKFISGKGQTLNPRKARGVLVFLPVFILFGVGCDFAI